jgi:uncharacterized RDD family membrane protein YckC
MNTIPYPTANLFPMKYATIWRRFWAGILDTLIFVPVLILTYYLRHHTQNPWLLAVGVLLTSLFALAYSIGMHSATGQTLGKMVTHIRVVDDEHWQSHICRLHDWAISSRNHHPYLFATKRSERPASSDCLVSV